jgi:hypothetical protein
MLFPACAGACVLVLALAIEKRNVRKAQECLGDRPSNRRNKKNKRRNRKMKQAGGPRGLSKAKPPRDSDSELNQIEPDQLTYATQRNATDTTQYSMRVANV